MKQHKKSKKAAKAIGDLNRRITVVKKKMKCIKNDLGKVSLQFSIIISYYNIFICKNKILCRRAIKWHVSLIFKNPLSFQEILSE